MHKPLNLCRAFFFLIILYDWPTFNCEETAMPMVGGKKYSYSKKGMAAAKKAAKKSGKKMVKKKKK